MRHNAGMKEPAILYLIVGLPGAGKTTKARQLEVEASALRFTPDEWMKSLFGRNDPATRDILEGRLIWIALRALRLHTNVILDFGFWSKDERSSLRWIAKQIGAKSQVIYVLKVNSFCRCCVLKLPILILLKASLKLLHSPRLFADGSCSLLLLDSSPHPSCPK